MRTSAAPAEGGFTLLELLVVMTILGVLAVAGIAALPQGESGAHLRRLAWQMAQVARDARAEAVATGQVVELRTERAGPSAAVLVAGQRHAAPAYSVQIASSNAGEHRSSIVFYPDGSSNGGTILIGEEAPRQVHIAWLTGRVSVR